MQLWLVLLGSLVALALIALFARVWVELELCATGEPTGAWAVVGGVAVGPFAFAGVIGREVPLRLELFCFGRRLPLPRRAAAENAVPDLPAEPRLPEPSPAAAAPAPESAADRSLGERLQNAKQYLGVALRIERLIRVDGLEVDCTYGFRDVALTGRFVAALSVIGAVLPRRVRLRHTPLWDGPERWKLQAEGRVGVAFGLVLLELLRYTLGRRFGEARPLRIVDNGQDQHLGNRR